MEGRDARNGTQEGCGNLIGPTPAAFNDDHGNAMTAAGKHLRESHGNREKEESVNVCVNERASERMRANIVSNATPHTHSDAATGDTGCLQWK
jgi:hypothetical protein